MTKYLLLNGPTVGSKYSLFVNYYKSPVEIKREEFLHCNHFFLIFRNFCLPPSFVSHLFRIYYTYPSYRQSSLLHSFLPSPFPSYIFISYSPKNIITYRQTVTRILGKLHPLPPSAYMACSGTALLYFFIWYVIWMFSAKSRPFT
jgi:hypothetical protein